MSAKRSRRTKEEAALTPEALSIIKQVIRASFIKNKTLVEELMRSDNLASVKFDINWASLRDYEQTKDLNLQSLKSAYSREISGYSAKYQFSKFVNELKNELWPGQNYEIQAALGVVYGRPFATFSDKHCFREITTQPRVASNSAIEEQLLHVLAELKQESAIAEPSKAKLFQLYKQCQDLVNSCGGT